MLGGRLADVQRQLGVANRAYMGWMDGSGSHGLVRGDGGDESYVAQQHAISVQQNEPVT